MHALRHVVKTRVERSCVNWYKSPKIEIVGLFISIKIVLIKADMNPYKYIELQFLAINSPYCFRVSSQTKTNFDVDNTEKLYEQLKT